MATLQIPCPQCGSELRLKDRSLLGRRGRCPKCQHRFVLEEPDEVELELADETPAATAPAVGTAAQWVPDSCQGHQFPTLPNEQPAAFPDVTSTATATAEETKPAAKSDKAPKGEKAANKEPTVAEGASRNSTLNDLQARRRKQRNVQIAVGGVIALLMMGAFFLFKGAAGDGTTTEGTDPNNPEHIVIRNGPQADAAWQEEKEEMLAAKAFGDAASPTDGDFIKLKWMPAGTRLMIHMRPADLYGESLDFQELRAALGADLMPWLKQKFEELAFYPPEQIEEAMVCFLSAAPHTPPDMAMLIRLKQSVKKSELILKFKGTPDAQHGYKTYLGQKHAYIIDNEDLDPTTNQPRTFAVGPVLLAQEMVEAQHGSFATTNGIQELLKQTDRKRHFTVVFEPKDLRLYQEFLIGENLQPVMNQLINWFGDGVETVSWSLHFGARRWEGQQAFMERPFFSELHIRNATTKTGVSLLTAPQLQKELKSKLNRLGSDLLFAVQKMNPQHYGARQIIGRLPAMAEAFSMSTVAGVGTNFVQLTTIMHERAGPNLTAGVLLAWDESTRTDFSSSSGTNPGTQPGNPQLPERVADRLNMQMEIEFNRTPLQEAFAYIGEEAKVSFVIDGDALKDAGYTKNMPQGQKLGVVTGYKAIHEILKQYPKPEMVVVLDEANKSVIVTTRKFADMKGLKPHEFPK